MDRDTLSDNPKAARPTGTRTIQPLFRALRPHQWVKNLFVAAPLLFSKHLMRASALVRAGAAVTLFSFLSSAVYLINDLFDVDKDRAHPIKRHRPIASGALAVPLARAMAAALIVVALGLAFLLGRGFLAYAASYLILNLAYSLQIKHIPFLDVLSIATGFLLRVLAGAAAIEVIPSPWLLVCTFLLASFLGFGKRVHELTHATSSDEATARRPVLARYQRKSLLVMLWSLAALTCGAYVAYTLSAHTVQFFGTHRLIYTAPFAAIGLLRFLRLVSRSTEADSPTDAMLGDLPFLLNLSAWLVAVIWTIYLG